MDYALARAKWIFICRHRLRRAQWPPACNLLQMLHTTTFRIRVARTLLVFVFSIITRSHCTKQTVAELDGVGIAHSHIHCTLANEIQFIYSLYFRWLHRISQNKKKLWKIHKFALHLMLKRFHAVDVENGFKRWECEVINRIYSTRRSANRRQKKRFINLARRALDETLHFFVGTPFSFTKW